MARLTNTRKKQRCLYCAADDDFKTLDWMARATARRRLQKPGPRDIAEFGLWPNKPFEALSCRPGAINRIINLVGEGTLNTGDYSGLEGPRELGHQLEFAYGKFTGNE